MGARWLNDVLIMAENYTTLDLQPAIRQISEPDVASHSLPSDLHAMRPFIYGVAGFALLLILQACASRPQNIEAAYVSPLAYQDYTCSQLTQELRRIGRNAQEVAGDQHNTANTDAVAVGVGIIFWPAFLFLAGDDRAEEFARLKGEADAVEQAAITKDCYDLVEQIDREREAAKQ